MPDDKIRLYVEDDIVLEFDNGRLTLTLDDGEGEELTEKLGERQTFNLFSAMKEYYYAESLTDDDFSDKPL